MITPARIPIIKRPKGYYFRWWYNGWHYWQFFAGALNYQTSGEKYRTYGMRSITVSSGQITLSQTNAIRTILNTKEVYLYTDSGWSVARIDPGTVPIKNNYINGYEITFTAWIGSRMISQTGFSPVVDIPIVPPTAQCETIIGTQIWMCKNWDAAFPGSKVYGNIEANRAIYGGLYTYDQIMSTGFCPPGWHIPTIAEWQTLINYLGGSTVAGGKLKSAGTTYWDSPNTGADNSSGFDARGGGGWTFTLGNPMQYLYQKQKEYFWAASPSGYNYVYILSYDAGEILELPLQTPADPAYKAFYSVRFIKDGPPLPLTYNDWFLPSRDELLAMYDELKTYGVGNFATGSSTYWSSSESSAPFSWAIRFSDRNADSSSTKTGTLRVRACRVFTALAGAYSLRDIGPAGGLIFNITGGTTYYEAAPSDQSASQKWSNIDSIAIGVTAQGTAVGTGQANTTAIIGQVGHTDSAAKLCKDLIVIN